MPKEKRNNLAIYTLAGSILVSSVLISMSQVNAHTLDTNNIQRLKSCVNSNLQQLEFAIIDVGRGSPFYVRRSC